MPTSRELGARFSAVEVLQGARPQAVERPPAQARGARALRRQERPQARTDGLRPTGKTASSPWGPDKRQRTISLTDSAWNQLEDLGAPHRMAASEVLEIVIRFAAAKAPDLLRLRTIYLPK